MPLLFVNKMMKESGMGGWCDSNGGGTRKLCATGRRGRTSCIVKKERSETCGEVANTVFIIAFWEGGRPSHCCIPSGGGVGCLGVGCVWAVGIAKMCRTKKKEKGAE